MKLSHLPKIATFAGCLAVCLPAAVAQNSILLLPDSLIEPTATSTSPATPYVFQSTIQELTCPSSGIYAVISSGKSQQQTGNQGLLVLDQIMVSNTPAGGSTSSPANVCPFVFRNLQVCFSPTAVGSANYLNGYIGQDPDNTVPGSSPAQTFTQEFGVGAIDISNRLLPGTQSVNFKLQSVFPPPSSNTANTTLYLNTNCTSAGVGGGGTVVNGTPPAGGVVETFTFDSGTDQGINFEYTLPVGIGDTTGLTEHVSDAAIDPATFDQSFTYGTSFSTASCYLHAGELLPNNNPACKMYTLLCSQGADPTESGAICPASAAANEIFGESFDPPANFTLTLPDIATPSGTYHTGVGLLMGPDVWTPGAACVYTPGSIAAEQDLICPQNLLFNFFGPGASSSQGRGSNVNSTFITLYGVPEPLTTVTMTDQLGNTRSLNSGNWTNNPSQYVKLSTTPPLGVSGSALPGAAEFVAAPIQNISYGLTAPGVTVPQPAAEPITTDSIVNAPACPAVGYAGVPLASVFTAPVQPLSLNSGDGDYTLHYYAQDCAGTQELQFLLNSQVSPSSWFTQFYSYPINLDMVPPTVSILVPSTGATYAFGQSVTANFNCSDDRSGLASCGGTAYTISNGTGPLASGPLGAAISTTMLGSNTFTVSATDFAGNPSSASVTYSVTQGPQTITGFTLPAQLAYAPPMAPIPLNATGGASGNPVTFTVHAGPGTIACTPNCALTITGLGTVTVYANQLGSANYTAAPQVSQSVVVSTYLAPAVSGVGASSVSPTSEKLSATINPENAATSYFFSYGTSPTSLTSTTTPKVLPAGVTGVAVSATLTGLQQNTTYYYRITAKSLGGQVVTPPANQPPLSFSTSVGP